MGMDLLNSQYDTIIRYDDGDFEVPLEAIYKHYIVKEEKNVIDELSNDREQTINRDEDNLMNLKRDKRKVQFEKRIKALQDFENNIEEDEDDMDKVGDTSRVIDQSPYYETTQNNPLSAMSPKASVSSKHEVFSNTVTDEPTGEK